MAPQYQPNTLEATQWGITAGGAPEAVAPTLSASLIEMSPKGVMPMPFSPHVRFEKIAKFVAEHGNAMGKQMFAGDNAPRMLQLRYNPVFEVAVPADAKRRVRLSDPPIAHPGVTFRKVDLQLCEAGKVTGGAVTMDVDAGGGIGKRNAKTSVVANEGDGAAIENRIAKLSSPLERVLGRLETEARLTDDGVEAEISVKPGPAGIPGFRLEQAQLTAKYADGQLTAQGAVGIAHKSGKIAGSVETEWNGSEWTIVGTAQVRDLIPGLAPFSVSVERRGRQTVIGARDIAIEQSFGGIRLVGKSKQLSYDVGKRAFDGDAEVAADLGMFGTASVAASIVDNRLEVSEFACDTAELKYPAQAANPLFTGKVDGNIRYRRGRFSGRMRSDAKLHLPGLHPRDSAQSVAQDSDGIDVKVTARVSPEGNYSGKIAVRKPVQLGKYFSLRGLRGELKESSTSGKAGAIHSDFVVDIVNLSSLKDAQIACKIDDSGFRVVSAGGKVPFGTPDQSRAWGELGATYSEAEGLALSGSANVKLTDSLIARGDVGYQSKTNEVSAQLSVEEIQLLNTASQIQLAAFRKQIPVFSVGPAGLYVDMRCHIGFDTKFDLALMPTIALEGLDLDDFSFRKAEGEIGMRGQLAAELSASPGIGVGAFAVSPMLLRGGGGLDFDIAARSKISPSGALKVAFSHNSGDASSDTKGGEVTGDAKVAMPVRFGIEGALRPHAELVLLDGVWTKPWQGHLGSFELLPERELFQFSFDLGGDLSENQPAPELSAPEAAPEPADVTLEQEEETQTRQEQAKDSQIAAPSGAATDQDGFSIVSLLEGLLALPQLKPIREIVETAAETWDSLKDMLGAVVRFVREWLDGASDAIVDALRGISEMGLFGYIKSVLLPLLGANGFSIIEPMLDALVQSEADLMKLVDRTPPASVVEAVDFTIDFLVDFLGVALGSVGNVASAIELVMGRFASQGSKLVNQMVQQGKLGVRRKKYYVGSKWVGLTHDFLAATEYKIHLGGFQRSHRDEGMITSPESAVAHVLWEVLEAMPGVLPTNTKVAEEVDEPFNDYWVAA